MKLFSENISNAKCNKIAVDTPKSVVCNSCSKFMLEELVHANMDICPYCGNLFKMSAYERIKLVADQFTFVEHNKHATSRDPLGFVDYKKKLEKAKEVTKLNEAIVCGECKINSYPVGIAVMDSRFIMGSMGEVVGEKIVALAAYCLKNKVPLIIFCASGGARMQEGILSLMQMARTTIAVNKLNKAGILFISILTNPTTGGVTASFAMQADIILSEPNALIGFAGPRVIRQTTNTELPEDFQTAEYLLNHGMIDKVIPRVKIKDTLTQMLRLHN